MSAEKPPEAPKQALLPVAPPPLRPPDADWLRGLSPAGVHRQMGEADFVRMEPGAHVMQYRGAACSLDVIFYADRETPEALRVSYLAARQATGAPMPVDLCLPRLVPPARWPPAS